MRLKVVVKANLILTCDVAWIGTHNVKAPLLNAHFGPRKLPFVLKLVLARKEVGHYVFIPNTLIPNALILTTSISQIQPSRITFYFPRSFLPSPLRQTIRDAPFGCGIHCRDWGIREINNLGLM